MDNEKRQIIDFELPEYTRLVNFMEMEPANMTDEIYNEMDAKEKYINTCLKEYLFELLWSIYYE